MDIDASYIEPELRFYGVVEKSILESLDYRASSAKIKSLLGDQNQIWLGDPISINIKEFAESKKQQLPINILSRAENFDFIATQFCCSFRPAPDCSFVSARIEVALCDYSGKTLKDAIALDLFPRDIHRPTTVKKTFTIKPELKFGFTDAVTVEASLVSAEKTREYLSYETEVSTYGIGSSTVGWDFNKTNQVPIIGSKDLFILIQKPIGQEIKARFKMSALVQTEIGKIPLSTFFFLSGSEKPLINELVDLI